MSPKRVPEKPREIRRRLIEQGWTERSGKGDHVNFTKPGQRTVTLDMSAREVPIGTLRAIYRVAGWVW